jgi:glycogen(starch) synthase
MTAFNEIGHISPYPFFSQSFIQVHETQEIVTHQEITVPMDKVKLFQSEDIYGAGLWQKLQAYRDLVCALSTILDFDIIHCHDWLTFDAGMCVKRMSGRPLALHVHALETDRISEDVRNEIYQIEREAMLVADVIFPVSHYTKSKIVHNYKIPAYKIFPIHNAVDARIAKKWKHRIPQQIVTFVGRVTMQKGPEYFFEAAEKVVAQYPDVKFVIAGSGDQLFELIDRTAYKQLGKHFIFAGFLKRDEIDALLSVTDVYFMPSVSEPFGLSALEAARAGVPCVISRQSGAAEVLTSALIADFWDTDLFAEHIVNLLTHKELARHICEMLKEDLAKISWDTSATQIAEQYSRILSL